MLNLQTREVLEQLELHGFKAYAVGGCVRDSLLNLIPKDWDVTTNALPSDIKRIFPDTFDTGIRFGTVSVKWKGIVIEVTTFRGEEDYEKHRKPRHVHFTNSLVEDLKRRDFTINALCEDKQGHIIDLFGGQEDLKAGVIRSIGNPDERFSEDALRMLRALRFAGRFHFSIDRDTFLAIQKNRPFLKDVSAERIKSELDEIVLSQSSTLLLLQSGLFSVITGVEPVHFDETLFCHLPLIPKYRYAYLFLVTANKIAGKFNFDKKTRLFLERIAFHLHDPLPDALSLQTLFLKVGHDALKCIILLKNDKSLLQLYRSCQFLTLRDLDINGKDLLFLPANERGRVLHHLVNKVFTGELANDRLELLTYVYARYKQ